MADWDVVESRPLPPPSASPGGGMAPGASPWSVVSSAPLPDQPQPSLTSELWKEGVVNPARQVASGYFSASAGGAHVLGNMADVAGKLTGTKPGGMFRDAEKYYEEKASEYAGDRNDVASQIYRGIGAAPVQTAEAALAAESMGPVVGMGALGAAEEADKGPKAALKGAISGALTGAALHALAPASRPLRMAGSGATFGAQTAAAGGDPWQVVASTVTGAAMGAPGGRGQTLSELRADPREPLPVRTNDPAFEGMTQEEKEAAARQIAARDGAVQTPPPVLPRSAQASAQAFQESGPTRPEIEDQYRQLFDQADKLAARRARQRPEIPETGVPENVARVQDARENLARQLLGQEWSDLNNPDRMAIDELVSQGYSGAPTSATPPGAASTATVPRVIPDAPDTIAVQLEQLRSNQRRAVLVPAGGPQPDRTGLAAVNTPDGRFYYNPSLISARAIKRAASQGRLNEILGAADGGMGPQSKADVQASGQPPVAVVGKDANGTPVQETLTTADQVPATATQTAKVTPNDGTVSLTTPDQVIAERMERLASEGVDLNRGSSTAVGLSDLGAAHALELGAQIARKGGVDAITTSDALRTLQTTQAISAQSPRPVDVSVDPNLESWRQGDLEGQPLSAAKAELDRLMKSAPDDVAPGQGPLTDKTGESYNQFTNRLLSTVGAKMANIAQDPNRAEMLVTHSQGMKAIRAWVDAGTPDNFRIDGGAVSDATEPPGGVERLFPNPKTGKWDLEPIDMNSPEPFQPGSLYIARHAETPISKENWQSPGVERSDILGSDGYGAEQQPPQMDARGVGQGSTLQAPVRPGRPAVYGSATAVEIPGESYSYPARYQVRELSDIQPSHNPFTFERNPAYALANDRDYADPTNQERVVVNSAPGNFRSGRILTDNPTATNGPSIVDADGNVLGGNNRAMLLARVYEHNPEGAAEYKAALAAKASQFGIDPADVMRMVRPVLVREVSRESLVSGAQRAITDLNKSEISAHTAAERATADARSLNDQALAYLQGVIESAGPDATLNEALSGRRGAEIVNTLVENGIFTPQEKPLLVDGKTGAVTAAAKERISKMMLGRLFRDSQQYQNTAPEMRNKLERIVPALAQVQGREGWDVTSQAGMFGGRQYSPDAIAIAKTLQRSPLAAAKAFRAYAQEESFSRPGQTATFFAPPSQREAFANAFADQPRSASNSERGAVPGESSDSTGARYWSRQIHFAGRDSFRDGGR